MHPSAHPKPVRLYLATLTRAVSTLPMVIKASGEQALFSTLVLARCWMACSPGLTSRGAELLDQDGGTTSHQQILLQCRRSADDRRQRARSLRALRIAARPEGDQQRLHAPSLAHANLSGMEKEVQQILS